MKKKIMIFILIIIIIVIIITFSILYSLNFILHRKYTNDDFNIKTYVSAVDRDGDGVDDQSDILNSVYSYIATKPKYQSKYYAGGYPSDEYGVCTDVVAFGLLGAGYDLRELVYQDIKNNRYLYDIEVIDKNIDFRRVRNLLVYFSNNAISLTNDINKIEEWQGGDIVVFKKHIGIVSDKRNRHGIPFVIHHANK